jgi:hypothetical protein
MGGNVMNQKRLVVFGVVCVAVLLAVMVFTDSASADAAGSYDKEMATKEGVADSLGSKKFDEDKLPGKLKIGFAIGSIITMIAVMKTL